MRNRESEKWEVLGTFKTGAALTNMLEQINQQYHINVFLICVLQCQHAKSFTEILVHVFLHRERMYVG